MAGQTWKEAYDEVAEMLGIINDATLVARLSRVFNGVGRTVSLQHDWDFLKTDTTDAFTMVAGTRTYNAPAGVKKIISIYYDRSDGGITELDDFTSKTEQEWRQVVNVSTASADRTQPTRFRLLTWDDEDAEARVRQVEFDPTPDAATPADALSILYFRFINELSSTSALIAYPDDFIELVKQKTMDLGFRMLRQPVLAGMFRSDFKDDLETAKNQEGMKRSGHTRMRNVYSRQRRIQQARHR